MGGEGTGRKATHPHDPVRRWCPTVGAGLVAFHAQHPGEQVFPIAPMHGQLGITRAHRPRRQAACGASSLPSGVVTTHEIPPNATANHGRGAAPHVRRRRTTYRGSAARSTCQVREGWGRERRDTYTWLREIFRLMLLRKPRRECRWPTTGKCTAVVATMSCHGAATSRSQGAVGACMAEKGRRAD